MAALPERCRYKVENKPAAEVGDDKYAIPFAGIVTIPDILCTTEISIIL